MSERIVLVTGASGFVGRVVGERLRREGWQVRRTGHRNASGDMADIPLGSATDWSAAVEGCGAVVHLAARAHVLRERDVDPPGAFREVNAAGTLVLARAAAAAGVRRLLFMSSIAVHGPATAPLRETDVPHPVTPYGISKLEAEEGLREIGARTGLEVTILRPPLVYGPEVGARFLQLLQWTRRGIPLPFAAIRNERSLVGVNNLADAIVTAITHPAAAGRTYLVADEAAISTPELIRRLAAGMDRKAVLLPVDPSLLRFAAKLVGRSGELERLIGSLVVDAGLIRRELGWKPPHTLEQGLAETARWFATVAR